MHTKPIAVSMGDPAGVGLEIAVRTFIGRREETPRFFLIGDADALLRAAQRLDCAALFSLRVDAYSPDAPENVLQIISAPLAAPEIPGDADPQNAGAITQAIARGVEACLNGEACALVTLPIGKAALYEAGFAFPGHTEFVAHLTESASYSGERGPVMMLAAEGLRVALVTIHTPLAEVARHLTTDRIVSVCRVVAQSLKRDFGVDRPRIALAGFNPHAGEAGALGREEIEIINPAAARLRAEGLDVRDAAPADTLFHAEARASCDAVVCMYHDQGLIPIKTLDFWGAANVTLGLPIVRASPDHGTAYSIAGKGLARPDSFIAALELAAAMAERRG
jgi:4-hydroxythreonine-4-phosphate dehydrogenase